MAQDPLTLHVLTNDTVEYALFTEKLMGNPKRYATYFPSKASIEAEQQHDASDDDDSTWEFNASVSHSSRSSSSTSCTSTSTPAQEIIIHYRSGMSHETRCSSPSQYSEPDSWEITSPTPPSQLEYVPVTHDQDIKVRYRQSRYDALLDTVCQFSLMVQIEYEPWFFIVSGSSWCCPSSWSKTKRQGSLQSTWLSGYTRQRRGFNVSPSYS